MVNRTGECDEKKVELFHPYKMPDRCDGPSSDKSHLSSSKRHFLTDSYSKIPLLGSFDCFCNDGGNEKFTIPGSRQYSIPSLPGALFGSSFQGPVLENVFMENISCPGGMLYLYLFNV